MPSKRKQTATATEHFARRMKEQKTKKAAQAKAWLQSRANNEATQSVIGNAIDALQEAGRLSKDDAQQAQNAIKRPRD